jgi:hypothetical protein
VRHRGRRHGDDKASQTERARQALERCVPGDYGKFAPEAAKLIKWTDPNIKLIAPGSSNFGANID